MYFKHLTDIMKWVWSKKHVLKCGIFRCFQIETAFTTPSRSSLRSYANSCHYREPFLRFHNCTIISSATSESTRWRFTADYRTGFTDKMSGLSDRATKWDGSLRKVNVNSIQFWNLIGICKASSILNSEQCKSQWVPFVVPVPLCNFWPMAVLLKCHWC